MRVPSSILLLALAVAAATVWVRSCEGGREPRTESRDLVLDRTFVDFGKVLHGREPVERFRLTNTSDGKRLVLQKVASSCSCASHGFRVLDASDHAVEREVYDPPRPQPDGSTVVTWLEPGETLELAITVHSGDRPPIAREEEPETVLVFDSPEVGLVRVGYKFAIDPRLEVLPAPVISLRPIGEGRQGVEAIELHPAPDKPDFEVTRIDGVGDGFTLTPIEATRPGGHRYRLDYGPFPAERRRFDHELRFYTDLEGDYAVTVRVLVDVVAELQLIGGVRSLTFGRFDFTEPSSRDLELRYHGDLAEPLLGVHGLRLVDKQGNDVTARFRTEILAQGGKRWAVRVHYLGGLDGSRFQGSFFLETAVPGFEELEIDVTGFRIDH